MEVLDIRQLIGEATEYDKKVALEVKKPKSWCKSVSAFANGMGGRLIWGIADSTPWDSFVLTLPKFDIHKLTEVYSDLQVASCSDVELGDTTQKTTQKISEMQRSILDFLSRKPEASRRIMVEAIEGITEDGIKYNLKVLQEKGLLKHVGPDKGGHWEVLL